MFSVCKKFFIIINDKESNVVKRFVEDNENDFEIIRAGIVDGNIDIYKSCKLISELVLFMFIEDEAKPKITKSIELEVLEMKRLKSLKISVEPEVPKEPEEPKKSEEPEVVEESQPKIQSVCVDDTEAKPKITKLEEPEEPKTESKKTEEPQPENLNIDEPFVEDPFIQNLKLNWRNI